ncbi:MAG: deoxyribodipyrimidine photo-lyase [Bacteroidetes bacterium]|nr:deoxyribodipyrimidine photo-lyase [Bacteroidota bacterium]
MTVDSRRIFTLKQADTEPGTVVYWMQRDQRAGDNWALLYAQERAIALQQPLMVVFCLVPGYLGATARQYGFMLKGLAVAARRLSRYNIPFTLLHGLPQDVIPRFLVEYGAGMLITDFNPLHVPMNWQKRLAERVEVPFYEVDAHNIIPSRFISDKQEYAAFTLRKKVERLLPEFLTEFPLLVKHPDFPDSAEVPATDWAEVMKSLQADRAVPEVDWLVAGETAAVGSLSDFIGSRLDQYETGRNFPDRKGQSDMSPYLHFGHLSPQRLAMEVRQNEADPGSRKAFLEELIVRRELADNFCLYNASYDRFSGFHAWAQASLNKHRDDPREYCYSLDTLEEGRTHDPLWNAAQFEMVSKGKMHGFMRMYWAKKILEWTASPEEAMEAAIFLNDKYELDGRDPNGYAGIAWSIGGVHDRPWGERKIFGMIRYMNYQGCKRKFDINAYISPNRKS